MERLKSELGELISIHALREEGDLTLYGDPRTKKFLSTPSARRATHLNNRTRTPILHFYPRPPRGGRLCPAFNA